MPKKGQCKPKEEKMVLYSFMLLPANLRKLEAHARGKAFWHKGRLNLSAAVRDLVGELTK